jgi:hypothetical protein
MTYNKVLKTMKDIKEALYTRGSNSTVELM